ncbi:Cytosine-specific methyltransferase [Cupriavidus necator]|uniref:Cytosine-specific methyltransferase n=1 Tax=Cupriavidus necator TaxID=106590 RepID=A0A1K0JCA6_CUPNE|nr:Cytosine-specific methyltransferase [Cupriavidus necator]
MRYLSICSGIEAATCAWHTLGWVPEAFSEIEAFPAAVLAHHYPAVPNRGDMTKFKDWPDAAIDLLVGGTPCQSFSVAGLRKGLADPRGNLMLTYLAIAQRYAPRWLVWENVPGVLSSNGGRDFGTLLGGLAELGYGFAYRVLDAQYVRVESHARAVPQRRRRVFVVGHLGDWRRAAAVLFERESLLGHPAPRREAGERIAGTLAAGAHPGGHNGQDDDGKFLVAHSLRAEGFDASEDGTGRGTPLVPVAFDLQQITSPENRARIDPAAAAPTMAKVSRMHAIEHQAVRRLMPMECERLQGFPDGYTGILSRGKPAADGARYKALGNSMAVNVMRWIGERIAAVEAMEIGRKAA